MFTVPVYTYTPPVERLSCRKALIFAQILSGVCVYVMSWRDKVALLLDVCMKTVNSVELIVLTIWSLSCSFSFLCLSIFLFSLPKASQFLI